MQHLSTATNNLSISRIFLDEYLLFIQLSIFYKWSIQQHVARGSFDFVPCCFHGAVSYIQQLEARHRGKGHYPHTKTNTSIRDQLTPNKKICDKICD